MINPIIDYIKNKIKVQIKLTKEKRFNLYLYVFFIVYIC